MSSQYYVFKLLFILCSVLHQWLVLHISYYVKIRIYEYILLVWFWCNWLLKMQLKYSGSLFFLTFSLKILCINTFFVLVTWFWTMQHMYNIQLLLYVAISYDSISLKYFGVYLFFLYKNIRNQIIFSLISPPLGKK